MHQNEKSYWDKQMMQQNEHKPVWKWLIIIRMAGHIDMNEAWSFFNLGHARTVYKFLEWIVCV